MALSWPLITPALSRSLRQTTDMNSQHSNSSTAALTWCLLSILFIAAFANLILLILVIKHQKSPSIRASQPAGQALIVTAGAVAFAGGCCLIAPHPTRITCAIAEPLIFSSITVIGSSLASMALRIERVASPILNLGQAHEHGCDDVEQVKTLFHRVKERQTEILTSLAELKFSLKSQKATLQHTSAHIRQSAGIRSLIQLIGFFVLPQFILQILNFSLAAWRKFPSHNQNGDIMCRRPPGTWGAVLVGTIFTVLPFLSALLTTSSKGRGGINIPSVLSLEYATKNTFIAFAWASIILSPILAFVQYDVSIYKYISTCLILAAVISPAYFTVWTKLSPIVMPGSEDMIDIMDQVRSSINLGDKRLERAIEALEQGRIFRELDLPNKSMKAYNDALDMWQRNGNEVRQFIGDFSISEIKTFNRRDCELMVKLLLAKASFAETAFVRKSAECYLKAIEIFEFAPSMDSVKDRSMIYPCFHSLFRLLREGRLDRDLLFERALAARFVQESKASSCYHHSCALAISAEMKARSGLIPEALEDVDTMSHIYRTEADSKAIQGVSGLDICLITHSRAALWFIELGDESAALNKCEFVINAIQHQNCGITDAYVVEVHSVLLPVIIILRAKCQGERMKYLYERKMLPHVEDSTMPIFVRNMLLVLSLSNVDNTESKKVDTEISKMIEQKEFSQEFDHFYISMGMSQNTLAAEACLYLARRRDDMSSSLIDKGLAFALFARRTIAENSHIIGTMAQNKNQKVFLDLSKLANEIGIDVDQGQEMKRISSDLIYTSFNRQIRPTLMLRAKKTLPHQLLLRHDTVAFVGLTHDSLAGVFRKAISEVPGKTWSSVYICYTADSLLGAFVSPNLVDANAEDEVEDFRKKKLASKTDLSALLTHCVDELHFYEVNHHCFFGSWFGWREEGGYIHISPSVWGVDVKLCPSQSYTWEPDHAPSPDYNAFRQGIENVIERASSYSTELEPRYHVLQKS